MASQATIIKDAIEAGWNLTGRLSKTQTATISEIVRFYDRRQVEGNEWPKAVTVEKINAEGNENFRQHPHFTEVRDVYTITAYYRVQDVQFGTYSDAIEDAEDMGAEIQRILETLYDPNATVGTFFIADHTWSKVDLLDQAQPELRRILTFTLTKIISENASVFTGFTGILIFNAHTYEAAYNVEGNFGSPQVAEPITGNPLGNKIPIYFTDPFEGKFSADMFLDSNDIGAAPHDVNVIGDHDSNGEVNEASFIQTYTNDAAETVTITTLLKITNIVPVGFKENLVKLKMVAEIIDYPTMAVA